MERVGFGIIGLGIWGETHAMAYSAHPQVELTKVCDLREERAREIARQYGAKGYCMDYREVLRDESISAVSIVTPDFAHTKVACDAAKAGKHVLLEKPMATRVADCEKIIEAAKGAGVKLMVDFHNRFNPTIAQTKDAIDGGELGELKMGSIRLNDAIEVPRDWLSWAGKSSVLWFLGSHCVDLVRYLFDDEVKRVYSVSRSDVLKRLGKNTPDFYQSVLELKRGAVVSMENCWIVSENAPVVFDFKLELVGTEGTMYVDVSHNRAAQKYTLAKATYPDVFCRPIIQGRATGFGVESIRHFADCVIADCHPVIGPKDGLENTRVLTAIIESARRKAPVAV